MRVNRIRSIALIPALLLYISSQPLFADSINWTTWTSAVGADVNCQTPATVNGSAGAVSVTYSGDTCGILQNFVSWLPATSYADGTIVANAPPESGNIISLHGGTTHTNTVTFSTAIVNPVLAIFSLGSDVPPPQSAEFDFVQTPTFVVGGPSNEFGGGTISVFGNTVSGEQGNGTVEFQGTFSSISWTNPVLENFYGFTVGFAEVAPVPEPASLLLLGTGLAAIVVLRKGKTGRQGTIS